MCFSKKRIKTCIRKYQTRDICTLIPLLTWLYQIRFTEKDFFFKLQTSVCTVIFLVAIILQKLAILQTFWFLHSLQNFVFCDQSSFFGSCNFLARQTQTFACITGFFNFWLQNFCENIKFQNFQPRFTLQYQIDLPRRLEMLRGLIGVLMDSPWMTCAFLHRHYCHLFS